jgi:uncharacterized protein
VTEPIAPLANVFTLGVRDFAAQRDFYHRMNWPQIASEDNFAAFQLGGAILVLFPVDRLAADGQSTPEPGQGGIRPSA